MNFGDVVDGVVGSIHAEKPAFVYLVVTAVKQELSSAFSRTGR